MFRLVLVGIATGLAFSAKHTGVLAAPIIALLALVEWLRTRKSADPKLRFSFPRAAAALVVTAAISLTLLWAFYGFRYAARPAGLDLNPPSAEYIQGLSRPGEAKLLQTIAHYKLLPESYIYGLADVRMIADFYASYLLGQPYPHGVWFYFPIAMLIKSTVPFLVLLAISVWAIVRRKIACPRSVVPRAAAGALPGGSHERTHEHRHAARAAYVCLSHSAGGRSRGGAGSREPPVDVRRRHFARLAGNYIGQGVSGFHSLCQRDVGRLVADVALAERLELRLGTTTESDQQVPKGTRREDCWFVYFGEGVVPYQYYGIPCKPLPTQDALWMDEKFYDVPAEIDGPVLISGADLSGFEYGPAELNPYAQFQQLKPTAMIQHGVFVFEGHFALPMAAAIGHVQKAAELLATKRYDSALSEAQTAVTLAPASVKANVTLGDVLRANGPRAEADTLTRTP